VGGHGFRILLIFIVQPNHEGTASRTLQPRGEDVALSSKPGVKGREEVASREVPQRLVPVTRRWQRASVEGVADPGHALFSGSGLPSAPQPRQRLLVGRPENGMRGIGGFMDVRALAYIFAKSILR